MKDPAPPPRPSQRTKFTWDPDRYDQKTETGWRWTPIHTTGPVVATQRGRGVRYGCVGLVALIAIVFVVALSAGGGSQNQRALRWTVHGQATASSRVGGTDSVQVTITNNGTIWFALAPASNLVLLLHAKDDWFKHHVITDPSACSINESLEGLDCGVLAASATKAITIEGSPKDAGHFDFELDVADEEGSKLFRADGGSVTWSENVIS